MNEIIERFKAESPVFFKKLKTSANNVGIAAVAMIIANKTFELGIDPTLITVLGYVACVCAGIAGTAKLTRE